MIMGAHSTAAKKYLWMGGVVLILLLLNFYQYGMQENNGGEKPINVTTDISVTPDDLQLVALDEAGDSFAMKRDIFNAKIEIQKTDKERKKVKKVKIPTKTIKEIEKQPTKEELRRQAIENDLQQLHFIGLVMKEGKKQAFLLFKGQSYIANRGLLINGKFRVEKIEKTSVTIKDQSTGISKTIVLTDE